MAKSSDPTMRRWEAARFALAAALAAAGSPALAQGGYSQAVVQPVAPSSLKELNAALRDLSRDQRNVPALLRAGWASLGLDDTQAALGYFRRALAIQPLSGEVKAGLASASLRAGDPVAAVQLFAEAEATGTPMARYAGDRGLALDLVGNNSAAQQYYRQALAQQADPEITRRLALSEAIAGDERATEATLLPLLQHSDLAAYRTRAFALAILGKGEEAVSIAQTMLPAELSNRMAPYLRYMPRLTRAQQAAAANLGQFPPASEIGRDDPRIAAFSGPATAAPQVASAAPDSRLVPTGQPLGRSDRSSGENRPAETRPVKPRKSKDGKVTVTYTPLPQAQPPAAPPPPAPPPPRVAAAVQQPASVQSDDASVPRVAAAVQPLPPQPQPQLQLQPQPDAAAPVLVASIETQPSSAPPPPPVEEAPRPSFSISPPVAAPAEAQPEERISLAEAFADFATPPPAPERSTTDAVDLSRIKPVRETARVRQPEPPKGKPKPKPPANPSRVWVQVGTGRSVKALDFTWRRLQKQGGRLLAEHDAYSARWGATRRLVTGPYESEDDAQDAIRALKKKGIDAFEFTSDEGEEVSPLS